MAQARLTIDLGAPAPAYQQIVQGLRRLLVAGELSEGERLPSVRDLALDLGVHHNTVAEAYRNLAAEGWLTLRPGRGARVRRRPAPVPAADALPRLARRIDELAAEAIAGGLKRSDVARELEACAARLRAAERRPA